MTWSRVFPILLVTGVISLLLSLTIVLAAEHSNVVVRDGEEPNEHSTVANITVRDAEPLPANQVYEGWFVSDDGTQEISIGILTIDPSNGAINATYTSADGENIFTNFNQVVITVEPADDADPDSSGVVYLSDTLPAGSLVSIRQLLGGGSTGEGIAVKLRERAQEATDNAKAAYDAAVDGDSAAAYRHSEAVLNIIDPGAGDLDSDGTVNSPGDGSSLLTHAADAATAGADAGSAAPNNSNIVENGLVVSAAAGNIQTWLGQATDTILGQLTTAIAADNAIAIKGSAEDVLFYTDSALSGAKQAYTAAQDMGTYELLGPAAEAPSVGDPLVPQMAMWALALGGALLAIGGFGFLRGRLFASKG